ncbi:winged helix-turn-helix transcriptional regulator [Paenibacillus xylanilyticus]|uniref:Helix-turn-helix transcriptional regulator n=1 Tax=Paenibacillus xylanilyticus TaxID=248903 RepID=A0A7Y6C2P0_9BACL|nr:helix-turn-helix domain-containing protein [Paenibacillus xylanilyticus]NUU78963.1 helix-turn-helix transcriptional regulator [Paenibacillus xylanilyticus]
MRDRKSTYGKCPGEESCPVEFTLDIIGGKWKGMLLYHMIEGPKRSSEFRRLFPTITQRMLTLQLRQLEEDGIVHREVFQQVPPKVEYSLTAFGRTLEPIIDSMKTWGETYGNDSTSGWTGSGEVESDLYNERRTASNHRYS